MTSDFHERAARIAERDFQTARAAGKRRRSGQGGAWRKIFLFLGLMIGVFAGFLFKYANENYVKSAEFLPTILMVVIVAAILAVSTVLGVILLLFGRKAIFHFCVAEFLGMAIAGVANVIFGEIG